MRRIISLGALSAAGIIGVVAQDPGCLETCVTGTSGKFTEFGCVDAVQEACLCPNQDFQFSVRDCSIQSCQASEDQALDYLFNTDSGFCKGHARPESSAVPSTSEGASTTEAPSTTAEAATTTEPTEETTTVTEEEISTSETPAPTTPELTTTDAAESTTAVESGTTASTSEQSSTADTGAAATSESEDSGEGEEDDEEDDESEGGGGGLSSGAAVGIGVGVAVAFIAGAIILGAFLVRRRRNRQPKDQSVDISRPMPPAAGRAYPPVDRGSFGEKGRGGESIEMHTNRYEDMPPRQTPRIMV